MGESMRKLISSAEAPASDKQHTTPCSDCPWRRDSLPGWLGGSTAEEFRQMAHGEVKYDCHAIKGPQCAGLAIYRANVCKSVRDPSVLRLPRDEATVFSTPMEFKAHHGE